MNPLLIDKHEKFFNRCLLGLPASAQSEDSNKVAIIYFCLHGLQLINRFNFSDVELDYHRNFMYDQFMIETDEIVAFRSTHYFKNIPNYDLPNLSSTLFALYSLLVLKSPYHERINRRKLLNFLAKSQVQEGPNKGGFVPTLRYQDGKYIQYGEPDLRVCYMALLIRYLVKCHDDNNAEDIDIDLDALLKFILDRHNPNGGFSSTILDESHVGFTFCAVATLELLGYPLEELRNTKEWLVQRQVDYPECLYGDLTYEYYRPVDIGGFNGRENKLSDTCYSWWCTGTLRIIDPDAVKIVDIEKATEFLLSKTQNPLFGGFASRPEMTPDPFHSYLALASLSIWDHKKYGLQEVDPVLVIPQELYRFFKDEIDY
ncbi:Geranylgeranyl transferase type-1 subunit beta [Candida viswanathii]|uniref:Geranylgeranyl transferase type-1 subunit beta n=1 Tax=Candida viswanathii TaxID=5486 RepID=A0A367Y3P4_9ASCO|nr:Geranylgeranyl transferase type-1 subunit beta [Candida viswanathii]